MFKPLDATEPVIGETIGFVSKPNVVTRGPRVIWPDGKPPQFNLDIPRQVFEDAETLYGTKLRTGLSKDDVEQSMTFDQIAEHIVSEWRKNGFGIFSFSANLAFEYCFPALEYHHRIPKSGGEFGGRLAKSIKTLMSDKYGLTQNEHFVLAIKSIKNPDTDIYTVEVIIAPLASDE